MEVSRRQAWLFALVFALLSLVLCSETGRAQERGRFAAAGSVGMLRLSFAGPSEDENMNLVTYGLALGIAILPTTDLLLSFSRASVGFLGLDLVGLTFFTLALATDLFPASTLAPIVSLGAGYASLSFFTAQFGAIALDGAAGVRLRIADSIALLALARLRWTFVDEASLFLPSVEIAARARF